jgi:hypothetical protein
VAIPPLNRIEKKRITQKIDLKISLFVIDINEQKQDEQVKTSKTI